MANDVKSLLDSGNKVFVEVEIIKGDIKDAHNLFVHHLNGKDWGRWDICQTREEADFSCRLSLEKKKSNLASLGARVKAFIEIIDKNGNVVWKSKNHMGNATTYTGFNSLPDAMRKIVRRAIKKELYEIKK